MLSRRIKSTIKDWLKVLVLLSDEAVAVVLVLLILRALEIEIPLPVAIVAALLLGAAAFVIHKAVIPTFHKKQITGAGELIGLEGRVIQPLNPVGVIRTRGEHWKAKSVGGNIAVGEVVEILAVAGLTLMVKLKDQ